MLDYVRRNANKGAKQVNEYLCIYIYSYIYIYTNIYIFICIYICYIFIYIYMLYVYIYIYVCMHIYIYTLTHLHVCMYTHWQKRGFQACDCALLSVFRIGENSKYQQRSVRDKRSYIYIFVYTYMDMEEALWKKSFHMLIVVGDKARIRQYLF